jgi:hypothetical protein
VAINRDSGRFLAIAIGKELNKAQPVFLFKQRLATADKGGGGSLFEASNRRDHLCED